MQRRGDGTGRRPFVSRLLDLYPTARPPTPALDTAGDRGVLADRLIAAGADLLICYLLIEAPAAYLLGAATGATWGPAAPLLSLVALAPLYVTYSFAFEWRYARTPGKVWRGLTTVTAGGDRPTLRASAVRNLLRYVDGIGVPPVVVGTVAALRSPRGRRVGDRLAGTLVVRTR